MSKENTIQDKALMRITAAPHQVSQQTTASIMRDVIIALVPTSLAGIYFFGPRAILVLAVAIIFAVLTEYAFQRAFNKPITIDDLSAVVTGLLLGLNCPASMPLWQVAFGSIFAIAIVKQAFGGLGSNFMNPALAARAVMMTSFASTMNQYPGAQADLVSMATPLAGGELPGYLDMFVGNMAGAIGEVSKLALLIGAAYLLIRRVISWEIPLVYIGSCLAAVFLLSRGQADLLAHLLSGGLVLGAFFMATDYATIPHTRKGRVIFALGCGILTAIIRLFGGYPEGVCFSLLIMNMFVPLIDRVTKRKVYGTGGNI